MERRQLKWREKRRGEGGLARAAEHTYQLQFPPGQRWWEVTMHHVQEVVGSRAHLLYTAHYALCTMHYALCTMHYALCIMYKRWWEVAHTCNAPSTNTLAPYYWCFKTSKVIDGKLLTQHYEAINSIGDFKNPEKWLTPTQYLRVVHNVHCTWVNKF